MPDELPVDNDGAPVQDGTQPDVDWQKRWTDTHTEYNRLNETFRRFESDPDALLEFIQEHHPDLLAEDDEPEPEPDQFLDDEEHPLTQEVQELREWRDQQEAAQQQAIFQQEWSGWENHVKGLASKHGVELSKRDVNALRVESTGQGGWPVGPDKAGELLNGFMDELQTYEQQVVERARKRPKPARGPGDGTTATKVPDLDDPQERVRWMAEQFIDRSAD